MTKYGDPYSGYKVRKDVTPGSLLERLERAYYARTRTQAGKALLVYVAHHKACSESLDTIAEATQLSRRTVIDWLQELVDGNYLECEEPSSGGRGLTATYRLPPPPQESLTDSPPWPTAENHARAAGFRSEKDALAAGFDYKNPASAAGFRAETDAENSATLSKNSATLSKNSATLSKNSATLSKNSATPAPKQRRTKRTESRTERHANRHAESPYGPVNQSPEEAKATAREHLPPDVFKRLYPDG